MDILFVIRYFIITFAEDYPNGRRDVTKDIALDLRFKEYGQVKTA